MNFSALILRDVRALQPAATAVPEGTLYFVTDELVIERSTGAAWETYSASGTGDVVGPGVSVDGEVVLYNATTGALLKRASGTGIVRVASGVYGTPGAVNLASEVTGDLPLANVAQASGASKILGRGSASGGGDFQELTISTGLTLTGTVLTASSGTGDVVGPASSVDAELALFDSTTGKLLKRATGTGFVRAASGVASVSTLKRTVGMLIGDGTNVISTGVQGFVSCPVAGTITKVRLLSSDAASTSGSIVVDVWKDTYANYPPTVADTITASAKPTITTATKSEDSTLTGWTTSVSAGDVFGFKVDSVTSLKRVTVELTIDE